MVAKYDMRNTIYEKISIIGDGGMATAMAMMLCEKAESQESGVSSQEPESRIQKAEGRRQDTSDERRDPSAGSPLRPEQRGFRLRPDTLHRDYAGQVAGQASHAVKMWGYDGKQLAEIEKRRENKRFLPGYKLPKSLVFEPDDTKIMAGADLIISAVPCQFMRSVWTRLKEHVPVGVPIVSVAKGIENETLLRPTEILGEVLGDKRPEAGDWRLEAERRTQNAENRTQHSALKTAVLSGPTIADELARKLPAVACAAAEDENFAKTIQQTFSCPWLRVYTNTDVVGVELAGAMKNVIAIAAGIIDGAGAGDNAKAALLSRGLAEITRLGVAMGARLATFGGLTGLGDLVTTCISPKGRNRSFGERVGRGQTTAQAENATESVVEGVATCKSVVALAAKYGVEMPITQAVYEVLFENKPVRAAISDLMSRQLKAE